MDPAAPADHRTRVAADRRERTRARLLASALSVFARRGLGCSVIQEVVAHANVAQGTFYNHFRTNEELFLAVSEELSDELLLLIESVVWDFVDPAKRIACGVRLYLRTAGGYPLLASFVAAAGLHAAGPGSALHDVLPPDIREGQRTGRFVDMPLDVAVDLVAGTTLSAVARIASGSAPAGHAEETAAAVLRALGLPGGQAQRLAQIELPAIRPAPESLLGRSHQELALRAAPATRSS